MDRKLDYLLTTKILETHRIAQQDPKDGDGDGFVSGFDGADDVPIAPEQEQRSENFAAWFGESKVVDNQGEPLVLYKGAVPTTGGDTTNFAGDVIASTPEEIIKSINRPSEFPTFDPSDPTGVRVAGFFTDDIDVANHFARSVSMQSAIFPVYLKMENPFVIDADGQPAGIFQFGKSGRPFRDAVRSGVYDGVIIKNTSDEGDVYVALDPCNIKSAIGNNGNFDPNNCEINEHIEMLPKLKCLGSASARFSQRVIDLEIH